VIYDACQGAAESTTIEAAIRANLATLRTVANGQADG
jgi:hypothetical protein